MLRILDTFGAQITLFKKGNYLRKYILLNREFIHLFKSAITVYVVRYMLNDLMPLSVEHFCHECAVIKFSIRMDTHRYFPIKFGF